MTTTSFPSSTTDLAHWTLHVDACCITRVRFDPGGHAIQHHAKGCSRPDHKEVALIVGEAVADLLGHPILVVWGGAA